MIVSETPMTDPVVHDANETPFGAWVYADVVRAIERDLTRDRDGYAQQVQRLTDELRQATRGAQ